MTKEIEIAVFVIFLYLVQTKLNFCVFLFDTLSIKKSTHGASSLESSWSLFTVLSTQAQTSISRERVSVSMAGFKHNQFSQYSQFLLFALESIGSLKFLHPTPFHCLLMSSSLSVNLSRHQGALRPFIPSPLFLVETKTEGR